MILPIILFFSVFVVTFFTLVFIAVPQQAVVTPLGNRSWQVKSIDTMKYSRDLAREKLSDPQFDSVIDDQIEDIAKTGANYVAIGTPYDEEFLPVLKRWVTISRKHHLHVWFRGNFSGWEEWFGYAKIDRDTHKAKVKEFITANKELFEDGDIFSSCPECENGSDLPLGDEQAIREYRKFLIEEYGVSKAAFSQINKKIASNYFSMNGDVARAVMDRKTTAALDGIVVVDHYVATPAVLVDDLQKLASQSGGQIVLGEFGAPIPDIHGVMNDEEQREWVALALEELHKTPEVIGVNYWVNVGGTTALWTIDGHAKPVVTTITSVYSRNQFFTNDIF